MKIYFTASIVGKKHHLNSYEKIIELLTKKGHSVISEHIIKTTGKMDNRVRFCNSGGVIPLNQCGI